MRTAEELQSTKESIYIERIKNLQAIIRHCECPVYGNPRFDMVVELTKKDKEFTLAINLLADTNAAQFKAERSAELTDEMIKEEALKRFTSNTGWIDHEKIEGFKRGATYAREQIKTK